MRSFILICLGSYVLGGLGLLAYLHGSKHNKNNQLQKKFFLWPVIFVVAVVFSNGPSASRAVIAAILSVMLAKEILFSLGRKANAKEFLYFIFLVAGLAAAVLIAENNSLQFVCFWLMSVMSDVLAFFSGNMFGAHKLPKSINDKKSWEGVAGQIAGSLFIYPILSVIVISMPAYFAISTGVGSALGDLLNSHLKRLRKIKNWSNAIPGHGGFADRLCSLCVAMLLNAVLLIRA
jgi:CDP-diglyceride synthetase